MMLASPHTLAPMLMRGNIPPTTTNNPPRSARKNGAGEARRRGGRRRGRPPSADRHRPRGTRRHPAPAPDTPQQQDALHSAHLHKRPSLPQTRTQPATGIDRRTPTTRCHSAWAKVSHTLAPGVNVAAAWSPAAAAAPTPRPAARPARTFLMAAECGQCNLFSEYTNSDHASPDGRGCGRGTG